VPLECGFVTLYRAVLPVVFLTDGQDGELYLYLYNCMAVFRFNHVLIYTTPWMLSIPYFTFILQSTSIPYNIKPATHFSLSLKLMADYQQGSPLFPASSLWPGNHNADAGSCPPSVSLHDERSKGKSSIQ
jgi:hypothetical protein